MGNIIASINAFVWGVPALIMILGVGTYLSITSGFAQLRLLPSAVRAFFGRHPNSREEGSVSQFQALFTALAATVGTGNIAGVAGAIALGGPGAVFWMWVCAIFGMIIKFAEASLAVRYRQKNRDGNYTGGPMYIISNGLGQGWNRLAVLYCFFGVVAAFGVGNATQINAVVGGVNEVLGIFGCEESPSGNLLIGMIAATALIAVLLGGLHRVGRISEILVPIAAVAYLILCAGSLIDHAQRIPSAFTTIITGAFSPSSVTGGVLGSAFIALRTGLSRGIFTNEAGMGTASIAHASAKVTHPVQQGLMGIMEVFLDTIVICTMTALVILCSGTEIPYGTDEGVLLTVRAFSSTYGSKVSIPIALFLCCFAFATMIGWGYYGMRCAQYLLGEDAWKVFVYFQAAVVVLSTCLETGTVWLLSEMVNGLMALPNLLTLGLLSPEVLRLIREYST